MKIMAVFTNHIKAVGTYFYLLLRSTKLPYFYRYVPQVIVLNINGISQFLSKLFMYSWAQLT